MAKRVCEHCGELVPLTSQDWYRHQLIHIEELKEEQ